MAATRPGAAVSRTAESATKAPLDVAPPPVLAKVEALIRAGRGPEAIVLAYRSAEDDVRRAFGLQLPKQWTHRELFERFLRRDMGQLITLLPRLYAYFEPVRYGPAKSVSTDGLMEALRAIYQEPSMRRLSWTIGADATRAGVSVAPRSASAPPARPAGGGS